MTNITRAAASDAAEIKAVTQLAFKLYKDELHADTPVKALSETDDELVADIAKNLVFIARVGGKLLGSIRVKILTNELAYLYRFSVHPDEHNAGVGSEILAYALDYCLNNGIAAVALHTNAKYFKLARYYYGKQFYVHSTTTDRGYIRALFVKELTNKQVDLSKAFLE